MVSVTDKRLNALVISALFVCSHVFAQSNTQPKQVIQTSEDSWLHPTDGAYQKAVQEGFTGKAKVGNYNEDKEGIHQVWFNFQTSRPGRSVIMFFSPLRCAQILGINAQQKLLAIPTVSFARKVCDGNLYVSVTYSSGFKADSFPLLLEHEGIEARPASVDFTESPDMSVYRSGASYTEYTYTHHGEFFVKLPDAWTDNVNLAFVAPEKGVTANVKIDFSAFAKDEAAYR
jgi:hypothetical protein